jgi:hypothetical protein
MHRARIWWACNGNRAPPMQAAFTALSMKMWVMQGGQLTPATTLRTLHEQRIDAQARS